MKPFKTVLFEALCGGYIASGIFREFARVSGYNDKKYVVSFLGSCLGVGVTYLVTAGFFTGLWEKIKCRISSLPLYWKSYLSIFAGIFVIFFFFIDLPVIFFIHYIQGSSDSSLFSSFMLIVGTTFVTSLNMARKWLTNENQEGLERCKKQGLDMLICFNPVSLTFVFFLILRQLLFKAGSYFRAQRSRSVLLWMVLWSMIGMFSGSEMCGIIIGILFVSVWLCFSPNRCV